MIKSAKRCLKKAIGCSCLTFDELVTLVTKTEAVLNSRPLTFVSTEDLEDPLTPSHLVCGHRVLSLPDIPFNEDDEDYGVTVSDLTRRARHLKKTLDRFWKRWKREYLLELREDHRSYKTPGVDTYPIRKGDMVTVYDESHPRGLWRLGLVDDLTTSTDGEVRGACVRVISKTGRPHLMRRPIQHLYLLEVSSSNEKDNPPDENVANEKNNPHEENVVQDVPQCRSTRAAALQARDRIVGQLMD